MPRDRAGPAAAPPEAPPGAVPALESAGLAAAPRNVCV